MRLICDTTPGIKYKSGPQKSRAISERWYEQNVYCFACESNSVIKTPNNTKGNDFICGHCNHHYELKTFQRRPSMLPDGAFDTMIEKITNGTASTFCLLERNTEWQIQSLTAFHASFLLPSLIYKRPALKPPARRAGWVGCDIKLRLLPVDAEIAIVQNGKPEKKRVVREKFKRFLPLAKKQLDARGWTLLTLKNIRLLGMKHFELADIYALEDEFRKAYPENRHIKDKIRQQLQILRDMGWLRFDERGNYTILE